MGHRDPVTPGMRDAVFARDREIVGDWCSTEGMLSEWYSGSMVARISSRRFTVCPAVVIDPNEFGLCVGRWTLDHILDTTGVKVGMLIRGLTRGKRAPSDLDHLISLCEGHTERGMKAGYQWNTANRPALRKYLRDHP